MPKPASSQASYLFTLRVWVEEIDENKHEWRGRIHHVASNERRYFRDWSALIPVLLAMVRQAQTPPAAPEAPPEPPTV
jgi:hypothetical protein